MPPAICLGIDDSHFRRVLGVPPDAARQEIRKAYRRLVMENHPDRFPPERKEVQELATISLGEAYAALMSCTGTAPHAPHAPHTPHASPVWPQGAVGPHRDPAYAYYKQGFVNFSIAVRGIAEVTRAAAAKKLPNFSPRSRASQDVASSLRLLQAARGYFLRVVERYPRSVWCADARLKLSRINRFTDLDRTILANLGGL